MRLAVVPTAHRRMRVRGVSLNARRIHRRDERAKQEAKRVRIMAGVLRGGADGGRARVSEEGERRVVRSTCGGGRVGHHLQGWKGRNLRSCTVP